MRREAARIGGLAPRPLSAITGAVIVSFGLGGVAHAQDVAALSQELLRLESEAQAVSQAPLRRRPVRSATYVEERLTDGELFYRLQDYARASIIFTDIVENHATHRAYPDALFLLGDSLFRAGDYLGARRKFESVLERAGESAFRPYVQRSLGRLIEVAIHTRDFDGVQSYFDRLSRLPPTEVEATTTYFRAKYLYNRAVPTEEVVRERAEGAAPPSLAPPSIDGANLGLAQQTFEAVPEGSPYYPQSRYFIGVIYTLRGEYPQAIEAFRRALRAPVNTPEHRDVVELTQLALGRLYYETDQLDQAIEAYQAVPRTSSRFDVALYEIAWVYIRMGDSTRAERALEVLGVADPDSRFIPDGKLLRGNLLLRNGRFDDAEGVFRDVRNQFGPVRRELAAMIDEHDDPRGFFRSLVRENLNTFDANDFLPPLAQRWAEFDGDIERALGVLGDLNQTRQLVKETGDLVDRLNAALNSPNAVNVFPDLRLQREQTISIRNRLARVRSRLISAEGSALRGGSAELQSVREQRRRIESMLGGMPTSDDDFRIRNNQLLGRYRALQRELSRMQVELMGIDARIVATERFLDDTEQDQTDPAQVASVRSELANQRQAADAYREEIENIERMIERARLQVGVGDARYRRDDQLRDEYNALIEQERRLLGSEGIRRPREVDTLFGRAAQIEGMIDRHDAAIDGVVSERTAEMLTIVREESQNLDRYRQTLASLEVEAEDVVGAVTYLNFDDVRRRFYDLVLRSDVGRIDVSWARREEHRMRVDMLTRERSREVQALDDEFREIMDLQSSEREESQ